MPVHELLDGRETADGVRYMSFPDDDTIIVKTDDKNVWMNVSDLKQVLKQHEKLKVLESL